MNKWLTYDKQILKYFNYFLMIQILPILGISSFLIYEINPLLFKKQMLYYGVGAIAFFVSAFIPWRRIIWWFIPIVYVINLLMLLAVDLVGKTILGAQRWIEIPGIGLTIQPSEFVKVSVIMMLAYMINSKPPPESGYGIAMFVKLSLVILIPFLLITKEPDLGTALVLLITGYGILFMVGINWKIWVAIIVAVGLSAPLLYSNLHDYQKKRITDFLGKPSYHVQQALIAIGSGGLKGKKKDEATQTQLKFLPISSSDFIFAYLGERFGFVGMITVISLYILLIIHLIMIAIWNSTDYLVRTFASGLAFLIFIYMGVNIYMIIGLAPVVGVPLPMFSHGGTSFIIFAVIFGILQNLLAFKSFFVYNPDSKVMMTPVKS
ncbi:RodA protein homolog [hydrothermal vent metagenome]|uniref:RodA protein homolog n=1 Tax=hydrothermal vent metagenome TaxID=652676 RepID=A0A1W1C781_9ZZZZ